MPQWCKTALLIVVIGPPVLTLAIVLAGAFAAVWATPFIAIYRMLN